MNPGWQPIAKPAALNAAIWAGVESSRLLIIDGDGENCSEEGMAKKRLGIVDLARPDAMLFAQCKFYVKTLFMLIEVLPVIVCCHTASHDH